MNRLCHATRPENRWFPGGGCPFYVSSAAVTLCYCWVHAARVDAERSHRIGEFGGIEVG